VNYHDAIAYLLSFADFERSGRFQDRPDVRPMLDLLRELGDPHLGRPTVHIAGSKGKGSVAAMAESILRAGGLKTGLYTSPHLHSYTERIQIAGQPLETEAFARLTGAVRDAAERLLPHLGERRLVTFDLLTALAFLAFREAAAGVQVVEVGLGGRLDSTNVFETKDVAVITPLSLEHTQILGDTVEQIAREKAAIITPGARAVMAPQAHPEAAAVIRRRAEEAGARLVDVAAEYRWRRLSHSLAGQRIRIEGAGRGVEAALPLLGAHQVENAAAAVAALDALREAGRVELDESAFAGGLASVRWPGRLEVLRERPLVVADGAHNRDSAARLRQALRDYLGVERAVFIAGSSADKDVRSLAEELAPIAERVIAVRAGHPRAMEPARLLEAFRASGVPGEVVDNVSAAIQQELAISGSDGVICVVGSLFVAAEAREHLHGEGVGDRF
jgi:dihydrofolate synthase/folylpolyglutamate synthase